MGSRKKEGKGRKLKMMELDEKDISWGYGSELNWSISMGATTRHLQKANKRCILRFIVVHRGIKQMMDNAYIGTYKLEIWKEAKGSKSLK